MKLLFHTTMTSFWMLLCCIVFVSSFNHTHAQDSQKLEELTRKLEELNKQIEACGNDLGCIQSKINQIQQVSKEIQEFQKELQKDPSSIEDELINAVPEQNSFPPPFDKITKIWLKHTLATSRILKFDCNKIKRTREEVLYKIDEIYEKKLGLTGPAWPLPLAHCELTKVILRENGTLNEPDDHYLVYKLEFADDAVWLADYVLLIGDEHITYMDKHSYKLGLATPHTRVSKVLSFSGWIMDYSKDPPEQLPLDKYKIMEQEIIDIGVQVPSYKGYTMIYPSNISDGPNDEHKIGVVKEYTLVFPYQIVRFYPSSQPDLFIDTYVDFIPEIFSPNEIQDFFKDGKLIMTFVSSEVIQEIEIGFPPLGCNEQLSSTKGAIILSGDCIDHGGYVIASSKNTIVNRRPIVRVGDKVLCFTHGMTEIISASKNNVTSNKKQIARIGDKTKCGATLLGGSWDTFIGDK